MDNGIDKTKSGIVLNRMYVGNYLNNNLGHEVINLFKADNGNYYIYLNSTGNFAKEHSNKIDKMLFVKYYDKGVVEVIGMAMGLEDVPGANMSLSRDVKFDGVDKEIFELQKDYVDNEGGVSYGGKSIFAIFNDAEQQSIFITYKAEKVYRTKKEKRIFICFSDVEQNISLECKQGKVVKLLNTKQAKASLKQYIYPESAGYNDLLDMFSESSLWEESVVGKVDEIDKSELSYHKVSLFDICQIQNDENCFSNALAYFMTHPEYYGLWKGFFEKYDITLNKNFIVEREVPSKIEDESDEYKGKPSGGRIDLLISDEENIVVIENKIKSDVNAIDADKDNSTQLDRYVNYVEWVSKQNYENKPNCLFLILAPKYNIPIISEEMGKIYKIITYTELYDYLKDNLFVFYNDANFVAFFEAMKRHTYENVNDYLYYEMQEKFFRRINQ